jgi:Fe2+ transport system protein FeoA
MHTVMPLEMLRRGEVAEVAEVHGEPAWVGRMAELGIRTGSRVRVLQPGAPCVLMVGESRLTLRGDDAFHILVHPIAG